MICTRQGSNLQPYDPKSYALRASEIRAALILAIDGVEGLPGRKLKLSARERRLLDAVLETPVAGEEAQLKVLPNPQAGNARIVDRLGVPETLSRKTITLR